MPAHGPSLRDVPKKCIGSCATCAKSWGNRSSSPGGEDTEVDKTIVDSISDPSCISFGTLWTTGSRRPLRIGSMLERTRWVRSSSPHGTPGARSSLRSGMTARALTMTPCSTRPSATASLCRTWNIPQGYSQLLMVPGFSTNTEVTEYSGRGVGMDVVKRNVEDVGGTVVITSDPGRGMTTTLKIP